MLAEDAAPAVPCAGAGVRVVFIRAQTGEEADDLLVGFSNGGHHFIQAKTVLALEQSESSQLAAAVEQCVRQYVAGNASNARRPWDRLLDAARDRLLIIVGPDSSRPFRDDARSVLNRMRDLVAGQPLTDAAVNAVEEHALTVLRTHVLRSWHAATGTDPSDDELRRFFYCVAIEVLAIQPEGANEREARGVLRTTVLAEADQEPIAWRTVRDAMGQLAEDRTGITRERLETELRRAGVRLQGVRSYATDIDRLTVYTRDAVQLLAPFASFESNHRIVKIPRTVNPVLLDATSAQSLVLVGDPGSGKSGALHELAIRLQDAGRAVVVLAAVDIDSASLGALRTELGLTHDLVDALANWRQTESGVLIIDGLDAARAEPVSRTLRNLIRLVRERLPNWHVVASIRVFDLRHGADVQDLFRGAPAPNTPAEMHQAEFGRLSHFYVPLLTDAELATLSERAPALAPLVESAPPDLRSLLRVPFNVQLLARLIDDGAPLSALRPLRTQGELLDLYWERRVRRDTRGDARETILRGLAQQMVDTRQLRADRRALALTSDGSVLLADLLSSHVLVEADRRGTFVSFAHHVLFDYAVARLILPATAETLAAFLAADPALLLVIRPSLVMHFEGLWRTDLPTFWQTATELMAAVAVPAIGEIIAPTIAADLATDAADFDGAFTLLHGGDVQRVAAERTLRYVVGALLAAGTRPHVGPDAGPWAAFAERLAAARVPAMAYAVSSLLSALTANPKQLTALQLAEAGAVARHLLDLAQTALPHDRPLIQAALTFVSRTIASDPALAEQSLRPCLTPERLTLVGFEEIPALAREANRIAAAAQAFAVDLYAVAFAYNETSHAQTSIGRSVLLPLVSNRKQDYEMALYNLADAYPSFLAASPIAGTQALIRAIAGYVTREHPPPDYMCEQSFATGEHTAFIQSDYSAMWDRDSYDDAHCLLQAFEERLCALTDAGDTTTLQQVIAAVIAENRSAAVWRRLFRAGAKRPTVLGLLLVPLLNRLTLTSFDTATAATEVLVAIFPMLDTQTRSMLELEVMAIAAAADEEASAHDLAKLRDHILQYLPLEYLTTTEARAAARDLQTSAPRAGSVPRDDEQFEITGGAMSEEEALAYNGVDLSVDANRRVRDFTVTVDAFVRAHNGTQPTPDQVNTVLPAIEELIAALGTAAAEGVHPQLVRAGQIIVAEAAATIPKCRELAIDDPALVRARFLLTAAAASPHPRYEEEIEMSWNRIRPAWSAAERIEAAQGYLYLAARSETCDDAVIAQLQRLAADPVAAVRFQVATRLVVLYRNARETMWRLLENGVHHEQRAGVAYGYLGTLNDLQRFDPERVADLVLASLSRFFSGEENVKEIRKLGTKILTALAIWRDVPAARAHINASITNTANDPDAAGDILGVLREPLGILPEADIENAESVRARAIAITDALLAAAVAAYDSAAPGGVVPQPLSDTEKERLRSIVGIIDGVARQLYFASGAHDAGNDGPRSLDRARAQHFYEGALPIIERLIPLGLAPAIHALLETLEAVLVADPARVFRQMHALIHAGRSSGYLGESSALRLVVRIIERYLADYRHLFQTDANLRQRLIEILNLFIEAGWPEALRFAARLDEVFR